MQLLVTGVNKAWRWRHTIARRELRLTPISEDVINLQIPSVKFRNEYCPLYLSIGSQSQDPDSVVLPLCIEAYSRLREKRIGSHGVISQSSIK